MLMYYVFFSYSYWAPLICLQVLLIYSNIIVQRFLFLDERSLLKLIIDNVPCIFMLIFFVTLTHLIFSWIGYNYLQAELQSKSNESILNNLKEGVLIIDEKTSEIQFKNNASIKINRNLLKDTDYCLFEESHINFDLMNAKFELVDNQRLKNGTYESIQKMFELENSESTTMNQIIKNLLY